MQDEDDRTALPRLLTLGRDPVSVRLRRVLARLRRGVRRRLSAVAASRPGTARIAGVSKAEIRARADAALDEFLRGSGRLALPQAAAPQVSILLVLFNQAALTLACLRAVAATVELPAELIIVDNASTDRTSELLDRLDGARIIRNPDNRHFLHAVNQAAALARGAALLLLNNDACLRPGALAAAWETLTSDAAVGAVGGRLVLPDGSLQEAGSIVWSDGSCLGYGRGRDPAEAEFQFSREVDYCSGAFLLLRRDAFERLGGFDPAYAPAYYEETDLCLRLRRAGLRVLYEPRAVIDHVEFASAGSSEAALALQRRNQAVFVAQHRAALATEHLPPGTAPLFARMRAAHRGRVLVIDDRVPFASLGVGYPRAAALLRALIEAGWFVTFYPLLFSQDDWAAVYAAFPRGMEVMLGTGEAGLAAFLAERKDYFDAVLVSRPHNLRRFLAAAGGALRARLIYDAEAVFATREIQRLALAGRPVTPERQAAMVEAEMQLARTADAVITVSEREAGLFRRAGIPEVHVLGHALAPQPTAPPFAERAGLLFVGALHDDPSPNTDSLLWFVREVMPLLDARIGDRWQLLVAGRATAARVRALAGPRIRLLGRVEDLTPLYAQARGFVAPTRYAGGIPHKVHEAAARGLPVVATSLLANQLGWSEAELLIADTPAAFAEACGRLLGDPALWERLRQAALDRLAVECDPGAFRLAVAGLIAEAGQSRRHAARPHRKRVAGAPGRVGRLLRRAVRRAPGALAFLRANGPGAAFRRAGTELRLRFGRRDYATWIALYDTLRPGDRAAVAAALGRLAAPPRFSLVLAADAGTPAEALRATLASVRGQLHADWEMLLAHAGSDPALLAEAAAGDPRIRLLPADPAGGAEAAALEMASGEFVGALTPGDTLRPHSLAGFAFASAAQPGAVLLTGDEDAAWPRRDPRFRPIFSPDRLRSPEAIGGLCLLRRDRVAAVGGVRGGLGPLAWYDLLLRVAEADPAGLCHVPRILLHRADADATPPEAVLRRVLSEHLQRQGVAAEVDISAGRARSRYAVPDPAPLVSVIVPTCDQPALLRRCVQGVLGATDYAALEVLIVDNRSVAASTRQLFEELEEDPRVRVLPYPHPFNYAAMNNRAVAEARGELVLLLNDDIAVREPGWLHEMVGQALRPEVGAVGAKLLYGDGTIQHAGVVTGLGGVAGHVLRHAAGDAPGYDGRLQRVQALSAVTGACMLLRRAVYQAAGGMDEANLPVSYNDIDLCLRLRGAGYLVIWTPHAVLDHLESATRGADEQPENLARAKREAAFMAESWGDALGHDPYYSPNLTLAAEDCGLAFPPRVEPFPTQPR